VGRIVFIAVTILLFYASGVLVRSRLGVQVTIVNRSGENLQRLAVEVGGSNQSPIIQLVSLPPNRSKQTYVRAPGSKSHVVLRFDDSSGNHHEGIAMGYLASEDCSDVTVTILPDFSLSTEEKPELVINWKGWLSFV
jgi:hypothetical protein